MVFHTNSDMVRHYCKELLEDGQEHSIPEIRVYVNEQTGQKGIDGEPLSSSHVGNVLHDLLTKDCLKTRRGCYQKRDSLPQELAPESPCVYRRRGALPAEPREAAPPQSETEKLLCGLKRMDEELSKTLTLSYCDLPLSGEGLQELFVIGQQIRSLIRQARELAAPAVQQSTVEDQGGPVQEAKGPGMGPMM